MTKEMTRKTAPTTAFLSLLLVCLFLSTPVLVLADPSSASRVHVVQRGQVLSTIAERYGTTVSAIVRVNGIRNSNRIYVGQRLVIPGGSPAPASLPATLSSNAPANSTAYVVRHGDTLSGIAWRHGTTIAAIARTNGLRSIHLVYPGQRLIIPGRSGSSPYPAPNPKPPANGVKWIDVDLSQQLLRAYQGDVILLSSVVSTGRPPYYTVTGRFGIRTKLRAQHMSGPGYYLRNVPHVMYFYGGYAIHGAYWHNNFGTRTSHGCVNMNLTDAAWLYGWAPMGTLVVVHY